MKSSLPANAPWTRSAIVFPVMIAIIVPSIAAGQDKPAAAPEVTITSTPSKTQKSSDLTARYRFFERYTIDDEHTAAGVVGSSRVAIIETVKESIDSAKGAPKRSESSRHTIFTERPFEINGIGNVTSVTRTYEKFKIKPSAPSSTGGAPLDGLSLLIRPRLADLPQILSLTPDRSLTEFEYDVASHQMFVPQISMLMPAQVVRIGDTWKIMRKAAQALLADPLIVGDGLVGKLIEIRKEVDGPRFVASIELTGKLPTTAGDSTVNAELLFTFIGESSLKSFSTKPTFPPRPTEDITEARGSITEIRLARVVTGLIPGPGRLRYQLNREMTMHRQIGLVEGAAVPPKLKQPPEASPANSWVNYVDPGFRYSFDHPQDLLFPDRSLATPEPQSPFMVRSNRDGRDMLQIEFIPRLLSPEDLKKELSEKYKQIKQDIVKGNEEWLAESDWPKMKVHRIDADVKQVDPKAAPSPGSARIHFDAYLILFGQSSSVIAISSTSKDNAKPYRDEIEKILKTIRLNPPKPATN